MEGQLRQNELVIPFRLTLFGPVIRYSFSNPDEALQLKLGDNDSRLDVVKNDGIDKIAGPEFEQKSAALRSAMKT